jgi:membrane associated rhomboid family serine protease
MADGFSYRTSYNASPYINRKPKKRPILSATIILIIITVLIFLVQIIVDYAIKGSTGMGFFTQTFGLKPSDILHGKNLWSIVTSIFLHGGVFHIIMNMLSLMFLGSFLEKLIGKKRFLLIYFVSGIVASIFFVVLAGFFGSTSLGASIFGSPDALAVGASGAIFGLAATLMILTPKVKVYIFPIPKSMPLWLGVLINLFALWVISASLTLPIGNSDHLGGFLCGLAFGLFIRFKYKKRVQALDNYFSQQR